MFKAQKTLSFASLAVALLIAPGCSRRGAVDANDLTASFKANRTSAPLKSALEVTYTWTTGPNFRKITGDYRALVHFLDQEKVLLFTDDHAATPKPSEWEPNKTYSYTRTVYVPLIPYVGEATVVMGLYPEAGRGDRIALKGEDFGLREYSVAKMQLLSRTENVHIQLKDGWHNPEPGPNPTMETTWTKKEASFSFRNPKKSVIVYARFDAPSKLYAKPPVLTITAQGRAAFTHTFENAELVEKKIRFKAEDLGAEGDVDVKVSMDQAIVPKTLGTSQTDDRELGVRFYDLVVGVEDELGTVAGVVDASPVAAGKKPAAKPAPKK